MSGSGIKQTLRMRYRALKETADKQELRGKVEECRRKLQDEFDLKRKETESELQKAQVPICLVLPSCVCDILDCFSTVEHASYCKCLSIALFGVSYGVGALTI